MLLFCATVFATSRAIAQASDYEQNVTDLQPDFHLRFITPCYAILTGARTMNGREFVCG